MAATNTRPVSGEALVTQVAALLEQGIPLGAATDYTDRDFEAVYALGHTYYAQARYDDAMKVFGWLVAYNHLERRFVKAFASALQMTKNYKDAVHFYTLAWTMDMTDQVPLFHGCECMIALGLHKEAREGLELVVRHCDAPKDMPLKERAQALVAALAARPGSAA